MSLEVELRLRGTEIDDLGAHVRAMAAVHQAFEEGENADPETFYESLGDLTMSAEGVLEWAAHVRAEAARSGVAV